MASCNTLHLAQARSSWLPSPGGPTSTHGCRGRKGLKVPSTQPAPDVPPCPGRTHRQLMGTAAASQAAFFSGEPRTPQPRAPRSCGRAPALARGRRRGCPPRAGCPHGKLRREPHRSCTTARAPRRRRSSAVRSHHLSASPAEMGSQTTSASVPKAHPPGREASAP